jgi:hypothetical protein
VYPSPRSSAPPATELRIFRVLLVVAGPFPDDAASGVDKGWDFAGVEEAESAEGGSVEEEGGGGLIGAALGVEGAVAIVRIVVVVVLEDENGMWLRKMGRRARRRRRQVVQSILGDLYG